MIRCPACGHENADTNNFCTNCGHSLAGGHESTGDTTRVVAAVESPEEITGEDLSADDVSAINQLRPNSALLIVRQGPAAGPCRSDRGGGAQRCLRPLTGSCPGGRGRLHVTGIMSCPEPHPVVG